MLHCAMPHCVDVTGIILSCVRQHPIRLKHCFPNFVKQNVRNKYTFKLAEFVFIIKKKLTVH